MPFILCLFYGFFVYAIFLRQHSVTMWLKISVAMKILSLLPPTVWLNISVALGGWLVLLGACFALDFAFRPADANSASAIAVSEPRTLQADEEATISLFAENEPSVVRITKLVAMLDDSTHAVVEVPLGSGSGIVWDKMGHIVTSYHVIHGASKVRVTFDEKTDYDALVVGFNQVEDVAVLRVDAPQDELRPVPVGVSANLLVGQKVHAIGFPFGLDCTLTTGVISGLRREISYDATRRPLRGLIQTDAAINLGNSGGPLLDSSGSLIGIITALCSPSGASCGIAYAIPVDTVTGIVNRLVRFGNSHDQFWESSLHLISLWSY